MNIFLGVYACEPHKGSEPEVGWQMVNSIANIMPNDKIYAITKGNNRESIEKAGYPSNIHFYYYDAPKWLTFWKKGGRGARTYAYIWMIGAALTMKRKKIHFDVVQHITFVNDWVPSSYHMLKTKKNKFIWGPIGSHDPIESKFLNSKKEKIIEKIRIFLQYFFRHVDPSFYITKKKVDCIIGINENVKNKLNLDDSKLFLVEPAIAMKKSDISLSVNFKKKGNEFVVLSVGRLIYIKNFKLSILSFYMFIKKNQHIENIKLKIIGEGQDKDILQKYVKLLGIEKNVDFVGQISRTEVQEHFEKADLFLFPTLESAGFVVLEAMSHALPIVAMEYGGPQQFVKSNKTQQLVSPEDDYEFIANNLAEKINFLYHNQSDACKIGQQNLKDVITNFTWEAKANKMKLLYKELLNEA